MKKTNLRRLASLFMALVLTLSISVLPSYAAAPKANPGEIVAPANIAITACENELAIINGALNCYGYTETSSSYDAEVIVELQKLGSTWVTVRTWTDKDIWSAMVDEDVYPESGTYRLKLTHRAYYKNSSVIIETITKNSNVVDY